MGRERRQEGTRGHREASTPLWAGAALELWPRSGLQMGSSSKLQRQDFLGTGGQAGVAGVSRGPLLERWKGPLRSPFAVQTESRRGPELGGSSWDVLAEAQRPSVRPKWEKGGLGTAPGARGDPSSPSSTLCPVSSPDSWNVFSCTLRFLEI